MKWKASWYDCFGFLWYEWIVLILLPLNVQDGLRYSIVVGCSFLSIALALLLLYVLGRRYPSVRTAPRWMLWAGAIVLSASKLLSYFGQRFFTLPVAATPFYTFLAGMAFAFLFYSFAQLLRTMSLSQIRPLLVRSQATGMGIYLLMTFLYNTNGLLFGLIEMSFPFIVALAVTKLQKADVGKSPQKSSPSIENPASTIRRTTPLMIFFAMATGFFLGNIPSVLLPQGHSITAAITCLSLLGILFYLQKRSLISSILNLGKGALAFGAAGCMVCLLNDNSSLVGYLLLTVGYFLFYSAMFIFFVTFLRYQEKESPGEILSLVMGADSFGIALGTASWYGIAFLPEGAPRVALLGAGIVFLFAATFLFNKKSLFPLRDKISEPTRASKEAIAMASTQLAKDHDLTPRQQEIFTLLAYGHRIPGIADMLGISPATVRTHAHFIYAKMDVHSSDELVELVRKATQRL